MPVLTLDSKFAGLPYICVCVIVTYLFGTQDQLVVFAMMIARCLLVN